MRYDLIANICIVTHDVQSFIRPLIKARSFVKRAVYVGVTNPVSSEVVGHEVDSVHEAVEVNEKSFCNLFVFSRHYYSRIHERGSFLC